MKKNIVRKSVQQLKQNNTSKSRIYIANTFKNKVSKIAHWKRTLKNAQSTLPSSRRLQKHTSSQSTAQNSLLILHNQPELNIFRKKIPAAPL